MAEWTESTEGCTDKRITKDEFDTLNTLYTKVPYNYRKNSNAYRRYLKEYTRILAKYGYKPDEVSISLMGYIRRK